MIFDENMYPFSKLHRNVSALLRKEILLLPSALLLEGIQLTDDHMPNNHAANPSTDDSSIARVIVHE